MLGQGHKNIAILQISRTGDILQTLIALKGFKKKYPDKSITFIARPQFIGGLEEVFAAYWDKLILFDKDKPRVIEESFDLLINLTFSDASAHLSSIIKSKEKWGMNLNSEGELIIKDNWSQFIFSNTMCGPFSPFNLVDVFKFILGTYEENLEIKKLIANEAQKQLIIHPFASQVKKKWKSHKWALLIEKIAASNPELSIQIVGSSDEEKEAEEIISQLPQKGKNINITQSCGKLSLKQLSELVKQSSCFLGHDSMIGHLAAFHEVPCITLSIGTVRPFETSPYGLDNINFVPKTSCFPCQIETVCSYMLCHNEFHLESIVKAVHQKIKQETLSLDPSHSSSGQVFITQFEKGLQYLSPLHNQDDKAEEIFRKFYFVIWSFIFEEIDISMSNKVLGSNTLIAEFSDYLQALNKLEKLYEFGENFAKDLIGFASDAQMSLPKIKEVTNKLQELDQLAYHLKTAYPLLSPIINFHHVVLANIRGNNLVEQATYSLLAYRERVYAIQILKDFILQVISQNTKDAPASQHQLNHPEPRSGS